MTNHKLRKLFYSEAYGGIYVEAKSHEAVKKWSWLEDVTDNPFHESEFQKVEDQIEENRKAKAYNRRTTPSL